MDLCFDISPNGRVEPYIGCPYPWVLGGMGVILLFMGGHGWAWFMGGFS